VWKHYYTGNVIDNGTLAFDRSDAVTFGGVISGTGSLVQLGSGTLTLTGNNTYSGGTTVGAGTLQLGNGGTSGSITGNVTDNGTLAFDRSDAVTFAGVIAGAGGVTQIGTGTTILTGTNTYSGGTIITVGTLEAGSASALSQNSEFTVNSILDLHGFNSTIASLSGTGAVLNNGATAAALAVGNNNASTTFSGVLQDGTSALQLTKSGTGTLTLTGANTYSGGTTISAGTLQIGNGGTTGSITGNVTDNGTLAFDRSDSVTFGEVISGVGTLVQ
jgi:fibronectin-binding autotransporter adhesin